VSNHTYYYRWCRRGHLIYGFSPINKPRCGLCGNEFVLSCSRCDTPLVDQFFSPSFFGTGNPVNPPQRPENCTNCGKSFPWNSKWRRLTAASRGIPSRVWKEFKSLSALHLILILILVLFIIGALTWHDLVEILKGVSKK